jgi:hypothetical protein
METDAEIDAAIARLAKEGAYAEMDVWLQKKDAKVFWKTVQYFTERGGLNTPCDKLLHDGEGGYVCGSCFCSGCTANRGPWTVAIRRSTTPTLEYKLSISNEKTESVDYELCPVCVNGAAKRFKVS